MNVAIKQIRSACKFLDKEQSLVLLGFPGSTLVSNDRYPLEILVHILAQPSGRLFSNIREKIGVAYSLGAYTVFGLDPGYIVIYVATTSENVEKVKKEILDQLYLLRQRPLDAKEIAQVKRALITTGLLNRQTNAGWAQASALDELYGLGYNHYFEYLKKIKQVGIKDLLRCAQEYFDPHNYALVVVGPKQEARNKIKPAKKD